MIYSWKSSIVMWAMLVNSVLLLAAIAGTEGQTEAQTINGVKVTPAMLYGDCNQRDKRCYGDTENCIQGRNCTFAASVSENRTHFSILMLDSCADSVKAGRHYYFAVGLTTLDSHRNLVCREPTFDDFKIFMLWDNVKCEKRNLYAYQMYWTWRSKSNWRQNCDYAEAVNGPQKEGEFTLDNYFQKNIILSSKDLPAPAFAARVDYKIQNINQYINRNAVDTEPVDIGFNIRTNTNNNNNNYNNNNNQGRNLQPGDAASQSSSSNSNANTDSSASSMKTSVYTSIIGTFLLSFLCFV